MPIFSSAFLERSRDPLTAKRKDLQHFTHCIPLLFLALFHLHAAREGGSAPHGPDLASPRDPPTAGGGGFGARATSIDSIENDWRPGTMFDSHVERFFSEPDRMRLAWLLVASAHVRPRVHACRDTVESGLGRVG